MIFSEDVYQGVVGLFKWFSLVSLLLDEMSLLLVRHQTRLKQTGMGLGPICVGSLKPPSAQCPFPAFPHWGQLKVRLLLMFKDVYPKLHWTSQREEVE